MTVVEEEIPVKDAAPERVTLRFTRHGPVIAADERKRTAFAVRSVWFEPGTSAYFASIAYMRARNWNEFVAGLRRWGAPGENQVYADRSGHIGWKPCGFAPIRRNWDGLLPVPGDGRYEWDGFLDAGLLPVERDPKRGWVATANAENLPRGYPYRRRKLGFEWAAPFRLHRIQSVLRRQRDGSLADSRRLQVDHRSLQAARTIPLLAHLEPRSRRTRRAIRLLRRWDRVLRPDSGAAALFEIWNSIELPTAVLRAALGSQKAVDAVWPGDPTVILELLEHPDGRLGRHPRRARDRALLTSLERAIDRAEALLGTRWSRWEWGKLHVARFEHPIAPAVDAALARRLAVGPVPVGGGGETVGDTGYSTDGPPKGVEETRAFFEVASGASFRQLIDVGAWDRSLVMNNPGQSGDPSSPHYRDLIERWAKGRTVPLLFSRERVEAAAELRIALYAAVRLSAALLRGVRRRLPEVVDLDRVGLVDPGRHRPHLHRLVALVAVRARRARGDPRDRPGADLLNLVAEAHGQRPARDQVDLLLALVVVARALLEVAVRRHADQRHRHLLAAEGIAQGPELARDAGAGIDVVDVVRVDHGVVAHAAPLCGVIDVAIRAAADDRGDVVADVMPLLDAVEDHHLHHRDHPRRQRSQLTDDPPLGARRARIADEREQLVGEGLLVDRQAEDARHQPRVGESGCSTSIETTSPARKAYTCRTRPSLSSAPSRSRTVWSTSTATRPSSRDANPTGSTRPSISAHWRVQ